MHIETLDPKNQRVSLDDPTYAELLLTGILQVGDYKEYAILQPPANDVQ